VCLPAAQEEVAPDAAPASDDHQEELAAALQLGARCEVQPGGKRGAVAFVGKCPPLPAGFWVGVVYDEPVGKNDGSVAGQRFFTAQPGYGGLVRPAAVTTGDFPELDEFASDDEI